MPNLLLEPLALAGAFFDFMHLSFDFLVAECFTAAPELYSPVAISVTLGGCALILPGCGSQCWTCL
jgi:hypothetical protein